MRAGDIIGKNVRKAREAKGWSVAKLARELNVGLFTIQQIEKGETQRSRYLPQIAKILDTPLEKIDPSLAKDVTKGTMPVVELIGSGDVPLYATTEAGGGALVMSSDAIGRVDRPRSLERIEGAYAVIVSGDSMGSVVRAGDIVVVNPHRHPRQNDLCVFRVEKDGEFRSTIKEYLAQTTDTWKVRRYDPEKDFLLKKSDWPECHVVVVVHKR